VRDITSYIERFDNILDEDLCNNIVKSYKKEEWDRATTGADWVDPNKLGASRKCYFQKLKEEFENSIFKRVGEILKTYEKKHPFFHTGLTCEDTGYQHLVYLGSEKGEYKIHVDHFDLYPRVLSISLVLNDDYEGGDFVFFEGEHKYTIKKKKGSAVVFPSNFCFPHAITPVSNGTRHAIITWIR